MEGINMSRLVNYISLKRKNVKSAWSKTNTVPYSLAEKISIVLFASLVSFAIATMVTDAVTAKYQSLQKQLQHHQQRAETLQNKNANLKHKVGHYEAVLVSILNEKTITVGYSKMQFKRVKASDDCKNFHNC
jgi:cell division protein FtsB